MNGLYEETPHKDKLIRQLQTENLALKQKVVSLETQLSLVHRRVELVCQFKQRFDSSLSELEAICHIEKEEDLCDDSAIAEEGEIYSLKSCRKHLELPVFNDTLNFQDTYLAECIRNKELEIHAHKEFIKGLKGTLEKILVEHVKTRNKELKAYREISELRSQLDLCKSVHTHN